MNPFSTQPVPDESTRCMIEGIGALERGEWRTAEDCFAEAGRLRDAMPWKEEPEAAWMRAAAWLNHGDALLRAGEVRRFREAVGSFDKAIESMRHVPLDGDPAFVDRLVLVWLNRAAALGETGDAAGAEGNFYEVERLLEKHGEAVTPTRRFLAAMFRVNRAKLWIGEGRAEAAWRSVREGLEKLSALELTRETAAAGIRARSLGCRALAMLLDEPGGAEKVGDWIAEATDLAEEALALVRASGLRDSWSADLVRYGARIYRACQPQFLGEFLIEWIGDGGPLAGDAALKEEMVNQLWLAIAEIEKGVLAFAHETEFVEGKIAVLRKLQAGLAAIR